MVKKKKSTPALGKGIDAIFGTNVEKVEKFLDDLQTNNSEDVRNLTEKHWMSWPNPFGSMVFLHRCLSVRVYQDMI